jgi:hypothetical protein
MNFNGGMDFGVSSFQTNAGPHGCRTSSGQTLWFSKFGEFLNLRDIIAAFSVEGVWYFGLERVSNMSCHRIERTYFFQNSSKYQVTELLQLRPLTIETREFMWIFPRTWIGWAAPKRGLVSRGLPMIDLHFFTFFFVIELYKGCWKLKMS